MPQDKKKKYYGDMTESLNRLNTPLTKKEELQAVMQRAKLLKENKELESKQPVSPSKRVLPGKNMLTVPSVAKRYMEKKAENMRKLREQKMNEPTSSKRVVGDFYMKTIKTVPKKK